MQVWNDIRVSKWWQHLYFWVNYPFKASYVVNQYFQLKCSIYSINRSYCIQILFADNNFLPFFFFLWFSLLNELACLRLFDLSLPIPKSTRVCYIQIAMKRKFTLLHFPNQMYFVFLHKKIFVASSITLWLYYPSISQWKDPVKDDIWWQCVQLLRTLHLFMSHANILHSVQVKSENKEQPNTSPLLIYIYVQTDAKLFSNGCCSRTSWK